MSVADRMIRSLAERSVSSDANSITTTFSSWNNCMAKAYCKWPVIAGIIVGSLIILSIAGCLISCICCGYQCCKGCCGCCYKCCDCGGSQHKRSDKSKYADPPQPYYQQPPAPEPMNYGYRQPTAAASSLASTPAPPPSYRGAQTASFNPSSNFDQPKTATFDQPKAAIANEDALPSMPTWADATTRHVQDHSAEAEELEMHDMKGMGDHDKSPLYEEAATTPGPLAGGLSRGMSKGGYNEVPGTYPSPHPSPHPMYDDQYHSAGGVAGYGDPVGYQDGYMNEEHGGQYGASADAHYFNQHPQTPGTQSPGYGIAPAGYGSRAPPRQSPSSAYRGFENQPPNFNAPGGDAYGKVPSPRSPPPGGMNMGGGYSPYDQQSRQLTHVQPSAGMHDAVNPSMDAGYSSYDNNYHQAFEPSPEYDYGHPSTRSPPPLSIPHQQSQQHQIPQGQYRAFSPKIASPPPSALQPAGAAGPHAFLGDHLDAEQEERPPSLLMAGRKATPNSYR